MVNENTFELLDLEGEKPIKGGFGVRWYRIEKMVHNGRPVILCKKEIRTDFNQDFLTYAYYQASQPYRRDDGVSAMQCEKITDEKDKSKIKNYLEETEGTKEVIF